MPICTKCAESREPDEFYKGHKQCKVCIRLTASMWAKNNRGRGNKNRSAWKKANPEKVRQGARALWAKTREKSNRVRAEWWAKHPEKRAAKDRRSYIAHMDDKRAKARARQKLVLDKYRTYRANRKSRVAGNGGSHTPEEAAALLHGQACRCANPFCAADLTVSKRHLDHKTPIIRGGTSSIENMQWLCATCNLRKHSRPQGEWLALMAREADQEAGA